MKSRIIQQLILAIVVLLLAASMTITVIYHQSNKFLKSDLKEEKLKSELLLSENLSRAKEIAKLKIEIQTWMGISPKIDCLLEEANAMTGRMEKAIPISHVEQGL